MIDLQKEIFEAKKSHNQIANIVLGNIKTAKENVIYGNPPKEYTEAIEANNLRKIKEEIEEELDYNLKLEKTDRANELKAQLEVIQKYMPKEVSEEEIVDAVNAWFTSYSHDTGKTIKDGINFVKNMYPAANGKVVATCVKKVLGL